MLDNRFDAGAVCDKIASDDASLSQVEQPLMRTSAVLILFHEALLVSLDLDSLLHAVFLGFCVSIASAR